MRRLADFSLRNYNPVRFLVLLVGQRRILENLHSIFNHFGKFLLKNQLLNEETNQQENLFQIYSVEAVLQKIVQISSITTHKY